MGQNQSSKFKHLTLENGLSQSSISCILKDSRGFMWFGTEDGLNKYDGNEFTVYRHLPNDEQSLSSSYIKTIVEQGDGFLWVGTKNGLNYFNPNTEKFTRYVQDANGTKNFDQINTLKISNDERLLIGASNGLYLFDQDTGFLKYTPANMKRSYSVISMVQDKKGYLWVLSFDMLEKIKLENGSFSKVSFHKSLNNSLKSTMLLDSLNLWIGTSDGLIRFNFQTKIFKPFKFYNSNGNQDIRNNILSITNEKKDKLWLGTGGGGLIKFDKVTNKFEVILHNPNNKLSLNSNSITSLFLDKEKILWLGTFGGGINKYDPNQFKFKHYKHYPGDNNSLSENTVRSVLLDKDRELWVGTHDGLNRINRETNHVKVYRYNQNNVSTISSNVVRALCEDSKGTIWIGTWNDGLNSFDKKTDLYKRYISLPGRSDSIGPVRALISDDKHNIWIGGNGLWRFNPITHKSKSYFYSNNDYSLNSDQIHSLYFDKTGLLWIGTQRGLISLDTVLNTNRRYFHNPDDTLSISHNYITSIAEDKNGLLWIGTYGGGLNILDTSTGTFRHYNTSNGLLNDVIYGILIDNDGYIWFTSNEGLGRFDPIRKEFKYFDVDQGIQSKEFNAGAYFKSKEGEFFFGGINGFNAFYPNAINENREIYDIVFTDFQFSDKERVYNANELFGKNISRLEHIELNYNQNNFSLKFTELNYANNVDHKYEYQLKGLNNDWHDLGKKRLISIGNLKAGEYILNVRVHNELTKKTSLGLTILPPYWKTYWAFLFYLIIVLLIIFLLYRNARKNLSLRKQFELKIKNLENDIIISSQEQSRNNIHSLTIKSTNELSIQEKFLQRTIEIIESNLADSSFDVERFADEIFMSKSQLYRKLKSNTGYSVTEFMRLIRLKKAAQLLKANSATVAEISYKVGFDNVGYFSKCFKELFGIPPSKYSK
jgi:ligand-binding sensor domain-containing protein/AraC-like DNA-binding protein